MNWPWSADRRECERLRAELAATQQRLERVIDNSLFAFGSVPIFHPEDSRFQPRASAAQAAEAASPRLPLSAGEWRQKIEAREAERAAHDRKARLVEQLRREAAARKLQENVHAQ